MQSALIEQPGGTGKQAQLGTEKGLGAESWNLLAGPLQGRFELCNNVLQRCQGMQVHPQVSDNNPVISCSVIDVDESEGLTSDVNSPVVLAVVGELINVDERGIRAGDARKSALHTWDQFGNGIGNCVDHEIRPLAKAQLVDAVTTMLDQRVAVEIGLPHWQSARCFAEEVVATVLGVLRPERC